MIEGYMLISARVLQSCGPNIDAKTKRVKVSYVHLVMCLFINFEWDLFALETECYSKMMSSDCMTVCIWYQILCSSVQMLV